MKEFSTLVQKVSDQKSRGERVGYSATGGNCSGWRRRMSLALCYRR